MCVSADREALVAHLTLPGRRAGSERGGRRWSGCAQALPYFESSRSPPKGPFQRGAPHPLQGPS